MAIQLKTVQLKDLSFMFEADYMSVTQKAHQCLSENPKAFETLILKCWREIPVGNFHAFYIHELQKYKLLEPNGRVFPNVQQWILAGSTRTDTQITFTNPKVTIRPLWIEESIFKKESSC